jgi:hypothetical protein
MFIMVFLSKKVCPAKTEHTKKTLLDRKAIHAPVSAEVQTAFRDVSDLSATAASQ